MGRSLVTPPDEEPVSVPEAKLWLRDAEVVTPQDTVIASGIVAARQYVEEITGRQLITQTWLETFDGFPCASRTNRFAALRLSLSPAIAITHIKYDDSAGVEQTLDTAVYALRSNRQPAEIALKVNQVWPVTQDGPDSVRVTLTVGYGEDANHVPAPIKLAIKKLLAGSYRTRESVVTGTIVIPNPEVERDLMAFSVLAVA